MKISAQPRKQTTIATHTGTRVTGKNMQRIKRRNDYPPDTNMTMPII